MPFTTDEFLHVFAEYNQSIFPLQFLFFLTGLYLVYAIFRNSQNSDKIISAVLSFYWLWIGIYYHLILFTDINPAAYAFGAIFILQGIFFFVEGNIRLTLSFKFTKNYFSYVGLIFIAYALILYPILGSLLGHSYPHNPTFGLPCPTTIFTFGLLLMLNKKFPYYIIVIPLIWSLVGATAAFRLTIYEDLGLLIAGVLGSVLLIIKNKKMKEGSLV